MIRLLLFLIFFLPFISLGQGVTYKRTGKVPKASWGDLKVKAEDFIFNYYNTLKREQLEKSNGELIVRRAIQKITVESKGTEKPVLLGYDLKINLQEGKYKAEVLHITFIEGNRPVPGERYLGPTLPEDKVGDIDFLSTMSSYQQATRGFVAILFKELDKALKAK